MNEPAPAAAPDPSPQGTIDPELAETLAALERPKRRSWIPLFVLSGMAFVAVGSGAEAIRSTAIVAGVLLVHELGHYVAMRVLGYRDVRMFFIPFFGALTTARDAPPSAWKAAVVAMAGPVPGIVAAAALLFTERRADPLAFEVATWALSINAFNLLPFSFLDGGRLLEGLLFQRHPLLEEVFAILSGLAFFALGFAMDAWLLGGLGILGFVAWGHAHTYGRALRGLRGKISPAPGGDLLALPRDQLEALHAIASDMAGAQGKSVQRAEIMRAIHRRVVTPPASLGVTFLFGGAWAFSILFSLVSVGVWAYFAPLNWTEVEDEALGARVEMPYPPTLAENGARLALVKGCEFQFWNEEWSEPDEAEPSPLRDLVLPRLDGQDFQIVHDGPVVDRPGAHAVHVRFADGTSSIFEVHRAAGRAAVLLVSWDEESPCAEAADRFFASYTARP